jgi:hypothetical protein
MLHKNRNCYTCRVRKENCGEAKRVSPERWTRRVCALWFPRNDMMFPVLDNKEVNKS